MITTQMIRILYGFGFRETKPLLYRRDDEHGTFFVDFRKVKRTSYAFSPDGRSADKSTFPFYERLIHCLRWEDVEAKANVTPQDEDSLIPHPELLRKQADDIDMGQ